MKRFSIIHIPVFSFFSKDLYKDVGLNWKGVNFSYLFLLLAVCWIPAMVKVYTSFSDFVNTEAPPFVNQVPEITITDGEASISEPQPYYIKDPDDDTILAIIDTTGTITSLEDPNAFLLLTKTELTWRAGEHETRKFELSEMENFSLDSERIMGWLGTIKKFMVILIYPFALLGSFVYRIIQALIYAAVGLLFAVFCKVKLSYDTLLRLAVVAMTPAMLLKTILGIAGLYLPSAGLVYLVIALGYLFFGVKVNAQAILTEQADEPPQEDKNSPLDLLNR